MRQIEPTQILLNGELKTASILDAQIISDDLDSSCLFYWMLKEADIIVEDQVGSGLILSDGNMSISGQDYINWDGSNDFAFSYMAQQLNVVLL
jgi:hypothetical protein